MSIGNDTREMSASLSAIWFGSKIKPQQKSDNINTMFSWKSNKIVSLFFPTAVFIFKSLPAYPRSSEWDSSFCSGSSLHGSAHWFWMNCAVRHWLWEFSVSHCKLVWVTVKTQRIILLGFPYAFLLVVFSMFLACISCQTFPSLSLPHLLWTVFCGWKQADPRIFSPAWPQTQQKETAVGEVTLYLAIGFVELSSFWVLRK